MKIVFFGDSITDANRQRDGADLVRVYGNGYVYRIAGDLISEDPTRQIVNRGVSGDRTVQLYARLRRDVWEEKPDVLSILVGVNDVWHELSNDGVDIDRFEKVYRLILEETKEKLPDCKIIMMEPFILNGIVTEQYHDNFVRIYGYAERVAKLAKEYGAFYLPLQAKMDEEAARIGSENLLSDGVHPVAAGAKVIADEWLKLFRDKVEKEVKC